MFCVAGGVPSLPAEGDLKCFAPQCPILGDISRLFSNGDLTIGAFEPENFLCSPVVGFVDTPDNFYFNNNVFILFMLLDAEGSPSVVCIPIGCPVS